MVPIWREKDDSVAWKAFERPIARLAVASAIGGMRSGIRKAMCGRVEDGRWEFPLFLHSTFLLLQTISHPSTTV